MEMLNHNTYLGHLGYWLPNSLAFSVLGWKTWSAHLSLLITSFSSTSICFRVCTTSTSISAARMSWQSMMVLTHNSTIEMSPVYQVSAFTYVDALTGQLFHLLEFCCSQGVSIVSLSPSALHLTRIVQIYLLSVFLLVYVQPLWCASIFFLQLNKRRKNSKSYRTQQQKFAGGTPAC